MNRLSGGEIAGIVIACGIVIVIIGVVCLPFCMVLAAAVIVLLVLLSPCLFLLGAILFIIILSIVLGIVLSQ